MSYVYHLVPSKMIGNQLMPLNLLQSFSADIHASEVLKYKGRENILKRRIPKLNCLWNDVIHLSSINPRIIFNQLESMGLGHFKKNYWYKIPIGMLDVSNTGVYVAPPVPRINFELIDDDIFLFNANVWNEPIRVSELAIEYFKKCKNENQHVLAFQFTDHVLTKSNIDISNIEIEVY